MHNQSIRNIYDIALRLDVEKSKKTKCRPIFFFFYRAPGLYLVQALHMHGHYNRYSSCTIKTKKKTPPKQEKKAAGVISRTDLADRPCIYVSSDQRNIPCKPPLVSSFYSYGIFQVRYLGLPAYMYLHTPARSDRAALHM